MPVLVVTFIALLELSKEGLLEVTQAEAFAPIYVRLARGTSLSDVGRRAPNPRSQRRLEQTHRKNDVGQ